MFKKIMLCSCIFEDTAKPYYYRSNDRSLKIGDYVCVPVANYDVVSVVQIIKVEYFKEKDLPMPLDRIKTIIGKLNTDDFILPNINDIVKRMDLCKVKYTLTEKNERKNVLKDVEIYNVDLSAVRHFYDVYIIIKESLGFPSYFGNNPDALWDCLTDMVGINIQINFFGFAMICRKYPNISDHILKILSGIKHYSDDRYIEKTDINLICGNKAFNIL